MNQRSEAPCIFAVEADSEVRSSLRANLQTWGYEVIMALDEADAMQRIQQGQRGFNLILLNQVGRSIGAMIELGRQLRQTAGLDEQTPIVILAEQYDENLEGQNLPLNANVYVSYLEDGEQLKHLLHRLCPV